MENLIAALGLMLVLEGLLPMIAPARWREVFLQVARLRDGQIRFIGMGSALLGIALLLF
ncbi:DUF2065 domain-containing protein [Zeimonas arvi]|uniref:DUF2065 domain-containing protein n=1 Tax=Zeimonas arvi TaxID=2498847 RepID=A0A5C8NKM8_9BURK|nr:DUF2065 domain-containing protein [Zeimonas arvi]TXL61792.1 DUF2065 domain-containing protein [Zeimonas arvi]